MSLSRPPDDEARKLCTTGSCVGILPDSIQVRGKVPARCGQREALSVLLPHSLLHAPPFLSLASGFRSATQVKLRLRFAANDGGASRRHARRALTKERPVCGAGVCAHPLPEKQRNFSKRVSFGKKAAANADDLRWQSEANLLAPISTRIDDYTNRKIDYLTNSNFCGRSRVIINVSSFSAIKSDRR